MLWPRLIQLLLVGFSLIIIATSSAASPTLLPKPFNSTCLITDGPNLSDSLDQCPFSDNYNVNEAEAAPPTSVSDALAELAHKHVALPTISSQLLEKKKKRTFSQMQIKVFCIDNVKFVHDGPLTHSLSVELMPLDQWREEKLAAAAASIASAALVQDSETQLSGRHRQVLFPTQRDTTESDSEANDINTQVKSDDAGSNDGPTCSSEQSDAAQNFTSTPPDQSTPQYSNESSASRSNSFAEQNATIHDEPHKFTTDNANVPTMNSPASSPSSSTAGIASTDSLPAQPAAKAPTNHTSVPPMPAKKFRKDRYNYASAECGAKVLAANPEATVCQFSILIMSY